jgi:putative membrane protein
MIGRFGGCGALGLFTGMSGFGWVGLVINALLIIGLVLLVVWIVRRVLAQPAGQPYGSSLQDPQRSAHAILAERYARGEIDREQYRSMIADLQ